MFSYDDLCKFKAVADIGNMNKAAQVLKVSQPTLSYSIKKLERELDAELFIRNAKGVRLTKHGELLRESADSFILQWESLNRKIQLQENEESFRLRIGAHPSVAQYSFPRLYRRCSPNSP